MDGISKSIPLLALLVSASVNGTAPDALLDVLAQHECRDITDDVRVTRFGDQWWVSLESLTGGESDFALYCQDNGEESLARLLLVIRGPTNPWNGCEAVVDTWRDSLPYRYHVEVATAEAKGFTDLSRWWLVNSSRNETITYGSQNQKLSGLLIDATNPLSGAGTMYACHSGEWYRIGLD